MRRLPAPRTRPWPGPAALALALLLALGVLGTSPAAAQGGAPPTGAEEEPQDPFERLQQIEERREALEDELDELEATDEELQAVLAQLKARVEAQQVQLVLAEAAHQAALRTVERAIRLEAEKAAEVADLEERMRQMAVDTFVSPPSDERLQVLLKGGDLNDLSTAMVYFDTKFELDTQLAEELERARRHLETRREAARQALASAAARSDEVAAVLTDLETTTASYEDLAAVVQARIGDLDRENAALYATTVEIGEELRERQRRILAAAGRSVGQEGTPLVVVRGIQVSVSIAVQLEAMLVAAEEDGILLEGGGYRSHEAQIATRRANCGDDPYSIYEKPPGECSPPTARPGTSMHEQGLAVDFTVGGSVISRRDHPAFVWLAEHAATYGFYNLPSEPWHWSTTGS